MLSGGGKRRKMKDELVHKTETQPLGCPYVGGTLRVHFDSLTSLRALGSK
jgi:hypothetical protein